MISDINVKAIIPSHLVAVHLRICSKHFAPRDVMMCWLMWIYKLEVLRLKVQRMVEEDMGVGQYEDEHTFSANVNVKHDCVCAKYMCDSVRCYT